MQQLESEQEEGEQQVQMLKNEIARIQVSMQTAEETLQQQIAAQQNKRSQIEAQEQQLNEQRATVAQHLGRVKALEEFLQPMQDTLDAMRNQTGGDNGSSGGAPNEAVAELKQILMALGKVPDLTPVA